MVDKIKQLLRSRIDWGKWKLIKMNLAFEAMYYERRDPTVAEKEDPIRFGIIPTEGQINGMGFPIFHTEQEALEWVLYGEHPTEFDVPNRHAGKWIVQMESLDPEILSNPYLRSLHNAIDEVLRENRSPKMILITEVMRRNIFGQKPSERHGDEGVIPLDDVAEFRGYPVTVVKAIDDGLLAKIHTDSAAFTVQVHDPHAPTE